MLFEKTGSQILLNNTYHLLLRPGPDLIEKLGGVHRFMGWPGPILTDSGGFQAFSMADLNAINDQGVTFKSIVDGSKVHLSPERAIQVQNQLGADIIMAFDDCPPAAGAGTGSGDMGQQAEESEYQQRVASAVQRTTDWLERCAQAHQRGADQALFGIVQGGTDLELRSRSVQQVCQIELPGYAIGGVAVGEGPEEIAKVVAHTAVLMPGDRPRYLMGVGYERDIVASVLAGVDMFDCVLPTRNGRNANAFTRDGQIRLRNRQFFDDSGPIEADCDCLACSPGVHGWETVDGLPFSRAYIRHLFMAEEMLGPILVSLHNVRHFQRLMLDIRSAIREDDWSGFFSRWPRLVDELAGVGVDPELCMGGARVGIEKRQQAD